MDEDRRAARSGRFWLKSAAARFGHGCPNCAEGARNGSEAEDEDSPSAAMLTGVAVFVCGFLVGGACMFLMLVR